MNVTDKELVAFGYAPGGYMCSLRCCNVGAFHQNLDKRAWRCRPCAVKAFVAENDRIAHIAANPLRTPQLTRDANVVRDASERVQMLDHPTIVALLIAKLHSETEEIARDLQSPEEYGDLYDTLDALVQRMGISRQEIERSRARKNAAKGGLATGKFWIPTAIDREDDHVQAAK